MADAPKVVTDIAPVHSLVTQVMQGVGTPSLLVDRESDPHHFQLRPSQARAISNSDALIWVGASLTPWLEHALDGLGPKGRQLELLDIPGLPLLAFGSDGAHDEDADHDDHNAADHDDHDEHDEHDDHDEHDHRGIDPHAWLSPEIAGLWVSEIAATLGTVDPENAALYQTNAAKAQARLTALDQQVKTRLAPTQGAPILLYHDAYGYFAHHFGLTIVSTVAQGDAADPGAAHLAEQRTLVNDGNVACLFPEAGQNTAYMDAIIAGGDARIGAPLDPSGILLTPGPGLYDALLTAMADTITNCVVQN